MKELLYNELETIINEAYSLSKNVANYFEDHSWKNGVRRGTYDKISSENNCIIYRSIIKPVYGDVIQEGGFFDVCKQL